MQKDAEYVFMLYGPPIGTLCIAIPLILYFLISQWNSIGIFTLIFVIFFDLTIALIVSCIIGLIPAFLTGLFFKKLIKNQITTHNKSKVLAYGFLATLLWVPIILLSVSYYTGLLITLCIIYFGAIVPATLYCSLLTRKFAIRQAKIALMDSA